MLPLRQYNIEAWIKEQSDSVSITIIFTRKAWGMKKVAKGIMMFGLAVCVLAPFASAQRRPQQEQDWDNAPKVVPRTTQEMQTPEYWIKRINGDPNAVIMTPAQIEKFNERNRSLPPTIKDINGDDYSIDNVIQSKLELGLQFNVDQPLKFKSFPGDSLRAMLNRHKEMLTARTWYDRRQMKYDQDVIDTAVDNMNMNDVASVIVPKYGILVKQTLNRAVPIAQAGYGNPRSWLDGFQSTSLDLGMPVAILHASKDRTWLYVRSEIAFGWILAENVAVGSQKDIENYLASKDILVALEYNVPVYGDSEFMNFMENLFIGSNVKLLGKSANGYKVEMPVRKPDGTFSTATGWVKPGAKVSVGYQPFTQSNIISTMFNMLYRPYGWADSEHEYDCCGTVRVVLRTFGMKTGRWTSYELHSTDHVVAFPRNTPKEKKYELLKGKDPGITLVGSAGHICMYLGEVDGNQYVIHQGGYSYKGDDGKTYHFRRVNVNDTELDGGSNISDYSEITTLRP